MLKRPLISQNSVIFHHLATFACNIYLDFWKGGSWRFAHFHRNDTETGFFGLPWAYKPHGREKRREGREGRRKKDCWHLIIFILPTLEIVSERQKSARDTPLGHLSRAVPFSKIRVYTGMKWAKMAKKCWKARSSARIRSFFTIWQHLLAISTWIFEKVVPERFAHFHRNDTETGFFGLPWAYKPHGREKRREGREGRRKKDCWHS